MSSLPCTSPRSYSSLFVAALLFLSFGNLAGCRAPSVQDTQARTPDVTSTGGASAGDASAVPIKFSDSTAQAGIDFVHNNGAFGLMLMIESNGSGVAWFDCDGDDDSDLLFVNGRDWTDSEIEEYQKGKTGQAHRTEIETVLKKRPSHRTTTCALYRNNGDGTFSDITRGSGLEAEMQGMGAAIGDYDNDGRDDLYITAWPRNYLFHNETVGGSTHFRDVTQVAQVRDEGYSTGAAWVDYDRDGRLDLFVGRYTQWSPETDVWMTSGVKGIQERSYSGPEQYVHRVSHLYHNVGKGRFVDVSERAGIAIEKREGESLPRLGSALGVAVGDFNQDLWPDLAISNDRSHNWLFQNNHDGTFTEIGDRSGVAYGPEGYARSGMGIDAVDIDHSNRESIAIGNFNVERAGLYYNQGGGVFTDVAFNQVIGRASFNYLTFGLVFTDFDNDSWPDLLLANGHLHPGMDKVASPIGYAERPLLFWNKGKVADQGKGEPVAWQDISALCGEAMQQKWVGRGLATADYDLDGRVDFAITQNGRAAHLLRNESLTSHHALRVTLEGSKSNRDGIGAVVWAQLGKDLVRRTVRSGASYLSQSELPITLGLGPHAQADLLVVRWPSGKLSQFPKVKGDQMVVIHEDRGIIRRRALMKR